MFRLLADENVNEDVLRGLLLQVPDVDLVRIPDVGLSGADDPTIPEWAAQAGRILLTHDVKTMGPYAIQRVRAGLRMPGVVKVRQALAIGRVIEDLTVMLECSSGEDWEDQILRLPL